ncbi:hypothetical protein MATL_G00217520 [Megalops atlanticus]|uniref:Uncharacterized protein n=1 Tax=Megalops atlanticus TaxID=7932 RepID=A0A9D3PGY2_MEGAT|nr:hypothetical protein MATL_G00217520 [Megalops atlanticus]
MDGKCVSRSDQDRAVQEDSTDQDDETDRNPAAGASSRWQVSAAWEADVSQKMHVKGHPDTLEQKEATSNLQQDLGLIHWDVRLKQKLWDHHMEEQGSGLNPGKGPLGWREGERGRRKPREEEMDKTKIQSHRDTEKFGPTREDFWGKHTAKPQPKHTTQKPQQQIVMYNGENQGEEKAMSFTGQS